MLIKHGDLQPITVVDPIDVSDKDTKKHLKSAIKEVEKLEQDIEQKQEGQNAK